MTPQRPPAATPGAIGLPPQYADAEALAEAMLAAARAGDWPTVGRLRTRLPALRASLSAAWQERGPLDATGAAERERLRLRAIGRVLAIDASIRELAQPWRLQADHWLSGRGPAQ